ncbi:MAG: ABC transporter substrate-binding protein [Tissierellia bacterium]|nr:ABC transporter substrate-binding protein [Tissierellia bacterium]
MKKFFCLLIALSLVACSSSIDFKVEDEDIIKIGWIGPLTGNYASDGRSNVNTLKMLAEELNEQGGVLGKKVEIITQDSGTDKETIINATRLLLLKGDVKAVIGAGTSVNALGAIEVLEKEKVPMILTSASSDILTQGVEGEAKPYTFRICFIDSDAGSMLGRFAHDTLGFKTVSILTEEEDKDTCLTENFRMGYKMSGGKILTDNFFREGDHDFMNLLIEIRDADPDAIFSIGEIAEISYLSNQARSFGITAPFIGGKRLHNSSLFLLAEKALEGSYILDHVNIEEPRAVELRERYIKRWNEEPEPDISLVSDAFDTLIQAIEIGGSAEREDIRNAISLVDVDGISGRIRISERTHNPFSKKGVIYKIEDRQFKYFGPCE